MNTFHNPVECPQRPGTCTRCDPDVALRCVDCTCENPVPECVKPGFDPTIYVDGYYGDTHEDLAG